MNKFASTRINQINQLQYIKDIVVGLQRKYASELIEYNKDNHKKYAWGKALALAGTALGGAALGGGLTWYGRSRNNKNNVRKEDVKTLNKDMGLKSTPKSTPAPKQVDNRIGLHPTANGGTSMDDTIKGISSSVKEPFDVKKFLAQSKPKPGLHPTANGGTSMDDTIKGISLPFKDPFDSNVQQTSSRPASHARSARQQRVDARQKKVRDTRSARQQKVRDTRQQNKNSYPTWNSFPKTMKQHADKGVVESQLRVLNDPNASAQEKAIARQLYEGQGMYALEQAFMQ